MGKELGFELDGSIGEFNSISNGSGAITFKNLSMWYAKQIDELEDLLEDWECQVEFVPKILPFHVSQFTDLVLHCFYTNRE